ncbi:MAG TPA: hypothetical protein PKK51_09560, partial [Rhodocyclaceae bacterium]|nr:hypothetical protein [Rhodocyclaceae bacterium]
MKHGTAGIAEDIIDLFFLEAPDYNFRTTDHHYLPNKAVARKTYNLNRAAISGQGTRTITIRFSRLSAEERPPGL